MILGAIALLVLALLLITAEVFLPSHGVLTAFAVLAALASVVMAYLTSPGLGAVFAIIMLMITPFMIYWSVKVYPTTAVGRRVMLDTATAVQPFKEEEGQLEKLVGRQGVAITMLRPSGTIEVADQRIDALAESEIIDAGTKVEIIRVAGLKVFVKAVG